MKYLLISTLLLSALAQAQLVQNNPDNFQRDLYEYLNNAKLFEIIRQSSPDDLEKFYHEVDEILAKHHLDFAKLKKPEKSADLARFFNKRHDQAMNRLLELVKHNKLLEKCGLIKEIPYNPISRLKQQSSQVNHSQRIFEKMRLEQEIFAEYYHKTSADSCSPESFFTMFYTLSSIDVLDVYSRIEFNKIAHTTRKAESPDSSKNSSCVVNSKVVNSDFAIGYVKLESFSQQSANQLNKSILNLVENHNIKSLIIDLRGNPGGYVNEALEICDSFLPQGMMLYENFPSDLQKLNRAHFQAQDWKLPLVLLTDGDSASASEIFAAAIKQNKRGLIVGRKTFGKGVGQTFFALNSIPSTLVLTTFEFFGPNRKNIDGVGILPDRAIALDENKPEEDRDLYFAIETLKSGIPQKQVDEIFKNIDLQEQEVQKFADFIDFLEPLYSKTAQPEEKAP